MLFAAVRQSAQSFRISPKAHRITLAASRRGCLCVNRNVLVRLASVPASHESPVASDRQFARRCSEPGSSTSCHRSGTGQRSQRKPEQSCALSVLFQIDNAPLTRERCFSSCAGKDEASGVARRQVPQSNCGTPFRDARGLPHRAAFSLACAFAEPGRGIFRSVLRALPNRRP